MKKQFDFSLYLVTDQGACLGQELLEVIRQAVRGGVTAVQLREKQAQTRQFVELAGKVKALLADTPIPLVINDRVDVALAAGADGVHLGQEDMDVPDARKIMGPELILGLSVNAPEQVQEANKLEVDYFGAGPIFPTPTKKDHKTPLGEQGLQVVVKASQKPVVAIGAITAENCPAVCKKGVAGIAVVSAICSAASPEKAARELKACLAAQGTKYPL
ncbi:MAG: thiamine phosphate synthase [Desulfohalobiaceae bacterium]|nr:thiamine phosphate synthase [Desulfohalobiaceae bacterium]